MGGVSTCVRACVHEPPRRAPLRYTPRLLTLNRRVCFCFLCSRMNIIMFAYTYVHPPKKVSPGGLNYDEVVVYDEDAALPSFLIVYSYYD